MKTITYVFVLFLLGTGVLIAQSNYHNTHYLDPYNPEYVKGEVLIKFKDETQINKSIKSGVAKTGITSVDILLEPYQIETIDKVFKETREQRQRKTVSTIRDFKGNEIEVPALFNIYKLKFDTIWDAKQIIEELQKDENIEFAEPNYLVYTSEVMENGIIADSPPVYTPLPTTTGDRDPYPNDPLYQDGSQWYLDAINAPAAWDSTTGDTTQIIAIIDTGVDWDHPDLDDNIWTNWNEIPDNGIDDDNNGYTDDTRGWDYINNDNDPNDDNSHGTHVAGIAAAEGNNGIGICGVAWNSKIMPIKMLQSSGSGNSSDFASAIEYASDNGATVINMSLGSYGESQAVKTALENAYAGTGNGGGSMLVAAAGNSGLRVDIIPHFPACYSFVLGTMASNQSGNLTYFSNMDLTGPVLYTNAWGHNYEITAPGDAIISCKPNGSYWQKNGTSMASPIVAGAISLMRQNDTTQSGEQIFAKLIQGANGGLLDIHSNLTISLVPDLVYIAYTIIDTLPGCDNDGVADAGETIQLYVTVKNAGGQADSVWTKIRFGEFEDITMASLIDTTSYIGSMSAYSTMTGNLDPFIIDIDADVFNNRDIVFQYEIGSLNNQPIMGTINLTIENAINVGGTLIGSTTWNSNKLYKITDNVRVLEGNYLKIEPATKIIFSESKIIDVRGSLLVLGKPDSLVSFRGESITWNSTGEGILLNSHQAGDNDSIIIKYSIFENLNRLVIELVGSWNYKSVIIESNIIKNNKLDGLAINPVQYDFYNVQKKFSFQRNLIINNNMRYLDIGEIYIMDQPPYQFDFNHNIFANNYSGNSESAGLSATSFYGSHKVINTDSNVFINNNKSLNVRGNSPLLDFSNNYYGMTDSAIIRNSIIDFYDWGDRPEVIFMPIITQPSSLCHGIVWKININNILINKCDNPYNSQTGLGVIGAEVLKYDVYFNRAMDTSFTPLLTFGVIEPFTQHIVADSASWSADSTIWTAYKTIDATTGDGIQRVRVANARDDEHFEMPIEDSRFEFVIQAAAAASIDFIATTGIGKVDLEWPPTPSDDVLGYNLYRSYNLTDSTYSDTLMINTELILDTVYTDYNVIPDTTYHYFYKTLGTDMVETDYSKKVTATPFDAANGDANGDIAVNVLDITTIVSYMLNQSPSPFLFDAADVNYDNEINVLDIIGLVQLINGGKSLSIQPLPEFSKQTAYYSIKDNVMRFESKGNVAALQFRIVQKNNNLLPFGEMSAGQRGQDISIFSLENGFEFSYAIVGDEIIGILYSMSSKEIPEGITELFRLEGVDGNDIEITEIFGGDLNGDYVPVLKKGENASIIANEAGLQVNPNPFSNFTQINYLVPENGIVNLKLFDLTGTEIKSLTNSYHQSGNHTINWNGTNGRGQLLKPGIYLLQIKVESVSGNNYNEEVKVIFTR